MHDIMFYVEKAIERGGIPSQRKLCEMLGVSHTVVTHWRRGGYPTDETMMKLAAIAGMDPWTALLDLNIMRSEGAAQNTYRELLKKITVALIALMIFVGSNSAYAGNGLTSADPDIHIITSHEHNREGTLSHQHRLFGKYTLSLRRVKAWLIKALC